MLLLLSIMFHAFSPPVLIAWFLVARTHACFPVNLAFLHLGIVSGRCRAPRPTTTAARPPLVKVPILRSHTAGLSSSQQPSPFVYHDASSSPLTSLSIAPVLFLLLAVLPQSVDRRSDGSAASATQRAIGRPAVVPLGGVPDLVLTIWVGRRPAGH